ncbi:hypothetical protein KK198_16090 [Pseudomonas aeruginosa]|uniref:hypothetical protein n=1 Tax=Pseudomonas aeruginosa TaxID=287 RepID=UPI00191301A1|nr:hypothetical protein [Pseudomonas aeruginosa]WCV82389.1 hypothetical protein KK198_16090 [Pseudomonas aeruginosa]
MSKELNKAPVEQAGGDEREAAIAKFAETCPMTAESAAGGKSYDIELRRYYLLGWDDRAALAQPSPAPDLDPLNLAPHAEAFNEAPAEALKPEQAEAERPEMSSERAAYFMRRFKSEEKLLGPNEQAAVDYVLSLIAQHERIVGALRFERQQMDRAFTACINERDAANARLHEVATACATAEQERDAALAEVERLRESKGDPSGSFDRCMKMMYERDENAKQLEVALARVAEYEAQAQHSVPGNAAALVRAEGKKYSLNAAGMLDSGAPEHAQTFAIVQLLSEFDDEEAESHWEAIMAYSDFRTSDALFHAAELLAAAPGKDVGHE